MPPPPFRACSGKLSDDFIAAARRHADLVRETVDPARDFVFDYFAVSLLTKGSYMLRLPDGELAERPQAMYMRIALALHGDDAAQAMQVYDMLSAHRISHASPTCFNAGTVTPQLASCFLLTVEDDLESIMDLFKQMAIISKHGGGLGVSLSRIRGEGAVVKGTGGRCDGVLPVIRTANSVVAFVNQGGKRKGAAAMYLSVDHPDVMAFLQLKKPGGTEATRARDLFYGLWVSDLFMRRVEADEGWSLLSPDVCPGLDDVWGDDYDMLYLRYEGDGKAAQKMKARDLFLAIVAAQQESGGPYVLFKDSCNRKSNQQNLGTIRGSNLCTEIIQYTSADETAVCNLATVSLPAFWDAARGMYDFAGLEKAASQLCLNLNRCIDAMSYPTRQAAVSNTRHRPIGIGVQGLADLFAMMELPWESAEAAALNRDIFETVYYGALSASIRLAERDGAYTSFGGSPAANGRLQFDLWEADVTDARHDWTGLKARMAEHGLRNSLLIAPPPTAATAALLGNNEAFEPFTSNIYQRRTLAGTFVVANKHLQAALKREGAWTPAVREKILERGGSVQGIPEIREELRAVFKTAWEIPMRRIIDMAADRGESCVGCGSVGVGSATVSVSIAPAPALALALALFDPPPSPV